MAIAAALLLAACGDVVLEGGTTASTSTAASSGTGGSAVAAAGGGPDGGSGGFQDPDADQDGDGFSPVQGDCDDTNPDVNPDAAEIPNWELENEHKPTLDDNCNGQVDEPPPTCDYALAFDSPDPLDAARAIELCQVVSAGDPYGVLLAEWKLPDSTDPPADKLDAFHLGHGVLPDLGPNEPPQMGGQLLALSTGAARSSEDTGFGPAFDKGYTCTHPAGMPFNANGNYCQDQMTGEPHDGIALELTIRPPLNAHWLTFRFRFYTHDWPNYVCTPYNDQFAALLSPPPDSYFGGNIAFDQYGNFINSTLLFPKACACLPVGCPALPACEMNGWMLDGSGFGGNGAASMWLKSSGIFEKGIDKITLRLLVYDAGDGNVDTTVLVDGFQWMGKVPKNTVPPE